MKTHQTFEEKELSKNHFRIGIIVGLFLMLIAANICNAQDTTIINGDVTFVAEKFKSETTDSVIIKYTAIYQGKRYTVSKYGYTRYQLYKKFGKEPLVAVIKNSKSTKIVVL